MGKLINILRKTIEGYQTSFDFNNILEYNFQTNYFVIDRIMTM